MAARYAQGNGHDHDDATAGGGGSGSGSNGTLVHINTVREAMEKVSTFTFTLLTAHIYLLMSTMILSFHGDPVTLVITHIYSFMSL